MAVTRLNVWISGRICRLSFAGNQPRSHFDQSCGTSLDALQRSGRIGHPSFTVVLSGCAGRTKPLTRQTLRVLVGRGFLFDRLLPR